WANEGSNVWPPRVGSQRHTPEPEHRLEQSLIENHVADCLCWPLTAVFLSHQQTFGTTPTACIRFAILSRIEILHILLEHSYDSQRNENASSARQLLRRQPVARSLCSVRSDSSSGGLPSSDRLHTSPGRIPAAS